MDRLLFWILFAFLFLAGNGRLFAQQLTLTGTVRDTLQQPLDVANVVVINQENQALDGFGITDDNGRFSIKVKANSNYTLKVSYLGFVTKELSLQTKEDDMVQDVVLEPQIANLEGVEVVYDIPISIKGDTIVYDTDSFVSGTERKLADVLSKLPGIEVNDQGEIKVEGKKVSKVMVEGEDFFDGDSKLASKNIPANALDKVEVLRNYSEVSQLSGVTNNQDNIALNIKLKEGKKKFWFGEITGGAGLDGRYVAHPKLFYYSPEFSLNVLTDLNNIGEVPFTAMDYWNFTGGFGGATRGTGTNFNTGSGGLGLTLLQNNRAKEINTGFGAVNFGYKPTSTWRLSGFGIYSYTNTLMETEARKTYIVSNQTETANTSTDQISHLGLVKFSSSYKPLQRLQWNHDVLLKMSDETEAVNTLSVSDVTDNIVQNREQSPSSIRQNSNLYYTLNEKHIFALETQYEYANENPFYQAIREQQPFVGLVPLDENQNRFNVNQEQRVITNRLDLKLNYFWVTGPKSNLNFTLGTLQSGQKFNSGIFQILDNGSNLDFDSDALNNTVDFGFSDVFMGLHYKMVTGKFTFNPGFHIHNYVATNQQLGTTVQDKRFNLVPDFFVNFQMKRSESLRFNYNIDRGFTNITNLARGYVFNNYNALYQGNRNLESALYHNLSLNFFSFSMFNMQNIFAQLSYSKRVDAFKSNTSIAGINQVNTTINSDLEDETLNATGNFQRTFGKVKISSGAVLSQTVTNNVVNDAPRKSTSFTQEYSASVGTSFANAPNVEMGYRYAINQYRTGTASSTFYTDRPFVKMDMVLLKSFIFLADYDHYYYRDKAGSIENKFGFLNASLSYQKTDSKWEYSINATNIANNQDLNRDNYNDLFFSTSAYRVQPRYVVFKIKYEL